MCKTSPDSQRKQGECTIYTLILLRYNTQVDNHGIHSRCHAKLFQVYMLHTMLLRKMILIRQDT